MEISKDLMAASSTPIVLAILARKDSYGYAILQRVRDQSGGRIEWTDGMLYPVLHRLERLGHAEARWEVAETGRRRKYYGITSRGRARLAEERRQWQAVDATLRGLWGAVFLPVPARPPASPDPPPMGAAESGSGARGGARAADRPVAELRPPPAGDPLRRRGGARGSPARAGGGAHRRGARHR